MLSASAPTDIPHSKQAAACPESGHAPAVGAPGRGLLRVARVDGASAALSCASTSPLRLLLPRARGPLVWAVAASHGGGLVGGDEVSVEVEVGPEARALLTTQAETKVYRTDGPGCRQALRARVGAGGLLALLPEPVSAFAGSVLSQRQEVDLGEGASLVLVDALAAGRSARGERWAFRSLGSANHVSRQGSLLLADAVRLAADEGPPLPGRLAGWHLLATVVLLGPLLREPAAALLAALAARRAAPGDEVLAAASPLGDGLHLRLAARGVEPGQAALASLLSFLPALLGEDPLSRRP
ncbi:MAG: urease accessory protein UreD [Deltaproteobacteria bacterium]|nr:urease accessory protein UreD [Deltaproteobacteria bacterium]